MLTRTNMSIQVHAVLEGRAPVIPLMHAILVGLGEGGIMVKSCDSDRELAHRVERAWACVNDLLNELRKCCASGPISTKASDLLGGGYFSGQKQPEKTLGKGLVATRRLGKQLLALRDTLATEADTLLCHECSIDVEKISQIAY